MSFEHLPDNWADLPLDTPGLAADVADLVVGHRDRLGGCIGLVLTTPDLTMAQPAVISDVDDAVRPDDLRPTLEHVCALLAEADGALLLVRGRDGSVLLTDADRRWHQLVLEVCRAADVRLLGAYLATPAAVRSFPEPLDTVAGGLAS